jgi:adenylate kinase
MGNNQFFVFNLNIPDEEAYTRSMNRRYCPMCHKTYSLAFDPGITHCKDDGTELIIRDDDKPEVIKRRIQEFNKSVVPTIEFLRSKGVMHDVNGVGPIEEIAKNIDNIIQEKINQS